MLSMLEGKLPRNQWERQPMEDYFLVRDGDNGPLTFDWTHFMEQLYDMDMDAEGPWDKEEWYCTDCILALIRMRLRKWWIMTKIRRKSHLPLACFHADRPCSRGPFENRLLVRL